MFSIAIEINNLAKIFLHNSLFFGKHKTGKVIVVVVVIGSTISSDGSGRKGISLSKKHEDKK